MEEIIKDIDTKIQYITEQVDTNLSQLLKDIDNKINEITGDLNIDDIIQKIKQNIKDALGEASAAVTRCIDKQEDAITQLAKDHVNAVMTCVQATTDKVNDIKTGVEEIVNKAMALKDEVATKVQKCAEQNNFFGLAWCITKEILPITATVVELQLKLVKLIADATMVIPSALKGLDAYKDKLADELIPRQLEIVDDIRKCLML